MRWLVPHAALCYANQWFVTDLGFMKNLNPLGKNIIDSDQLGKLAAKYMVARGFKKDEDAPAARWVSAAAELRKSLTTSRVTPVEVHKLAKRLGQVAPVNGTTGSLLISAATKFLWFAGEHNVRILDRRAVLALEQLCNLSRLGADYERYATAWNEQFEAHKQEIQRAVADLPEQLGWACIPPSQHHDAKAEFKQPWFAERVFDKYLWTIGADEDGSATSFI